MTKAFKIEGECDSSGTLIHNPIHSLEGRGCGIIDQLNIILQGTSSQGTSSQGSSMYIQAELKCANIFVGDEFCALRNLYHHPLCHTSTAMTTMNMLLVTRFESLREYPRGT